jgi:hypothetical protein
MLRCDALDASSRKEALGLPMLCAIARRRIPTPATKNLLWRAEPFGEKPSRAQDFPFSRKTRFRLGAARRTNVETYPWPTDAETGAAAKAQG